MPFRLLRQRAALALAASISLLGSAEPARSVSIYQIGNSLTWDSKPEGLAAMLETVTGTPVTGGYHIRGNQTLDYIWNNPDESNELSDQGPHTQALPNNHWDYLTLQTFPANSQPTLGQELARIQDFVAAADLGSSGTTEIIVYGPWPGRGSNWNRWGESVSGSLDQRTLYVEAYQNLLFDRVASLYPGRVRMAAPSKVMREVLDRMEQGQGPIQDWGELYRDTIHLTELGRFIASTTVLATITGESPVGIPVPRDVEFWGPDSSNYFSDEIALELQQIVWDVVSSDRRSGITPAGDLNLDRIVGQADYGLWAADYGATDGPGGDRAADANRDGVVNAADYTLWRDGLVPTQSVTASIPEPTAAGLALVAGLSLATRRRV